MGYSNGNETHLDDLLIEKAINSVFAEWQIHGRIAQGFDFTLMEEVSFN